MKDNDWKSHLASLTKENADFKLQEDNHISTVQEEESENKEVLSSLVYVELDKKGRKGKQATIISGFEKEDDDTLKEMAKWLKTTCGVGGSTRGSEILLQGDFREKVVFLLSQKGYRVKRIN